MYSYYKCVKYIQNYNLTECILIILQKLESSLRILEGFLDRAVKIGIKNFTADDRYDPNNVNDYLGHGTSVASIIGASGNIIGVAPKCNLLILKALSKGGGKTVWVTEAINYAISQGVDIINMSLGSTREDKDMHNAIKKAISTPETRRVIC